MEFSIHVDLSPVIGAVQAVFDEKVLPALSEAVWDTALKAQEDWMTAVQKAKLWQGERDNYASTIEVERTGPYSALVYSDYQYAEDIEKGRPAFDLKYMLRTSNKTRMSKAGHVYLIIPFRHNVSSMPAAVRTAAKALAPSRVTGYTYRVSATLAIVRQNLYNWGGRLKADAVPKMQRKHVGMVRFDTSTPKSARSSYMTFRVMTDRSPGWIIPASPGLNIVKGVVDRLQPIAEASFTRAISSIAA